MRTVIKFLLFMALPFGCSTIAECETTKTVSCVGSLVSFSYDEPTDLKCLCQSTSDALEFLQSQGLPTTDKITIRIVSQIPKDQKHDLLGSYDPEKHEIKILSFDRSKELSEKIFNIEMTDDLWCSFAAHELTHVISSQCMNHKVTDHIASEYLAYVTQLVVLKEETREKILREFSATSAYTSLRNLSATYFLLNPEKFAIKCYLHFISLDNNKTILDELVNFCE